MKVRLILSGVFLLATSTACSVKSELKYSESADKWTINGTESSVSEVEKFLLEETSSGTRLVYLRDNGDLSTYTLQEFHLALAGAPATETRLSHENHERDPGNPFIPSKAEQIRISELSETLEKLRVGQLDYEFFGITSNGADCLYFKFEGSRFNLEFEAMSEEQKPLFDKLVAYSERNGIKTVKTTYGNEPNYESMFFAPVLRLEINASLDDAKEIGTKLMSEVFGNDEDTVYEVVP